MTGSSEQPPEPREATSRPVQLMLDGLNWIYDRALEGGLGMAGAEEMADSYFAATGSPEAAIDSLIRWQVAKASATGFVTNIGGLITLPVAIPVNLTGVLFIQLNMVAAIAHLRGHSIHSDRVRSFAYVSLIGDRARAVLKEAGVNIGTRLTAQAISRISGATLIRINQAVGFRLVTKAGTDGVVNLAKFSQLGGGIVGGTIDGATTRGIGAVAKKLFPPIGAE